MVDVRGVAYLDARRYSFADAQRLAETWRGFAPGRDDLREAMADALALPQRQLDPRLLGALAALETETSSVAEAALQVGLSESRLTHLMTEALARRHASGAAGSGCNARSARPC